MLYNIGLISVIHQHELVIGVCPLSLESPSHPSPLSFLMESFKLNRRVVSKVQCTLFILIYQFCFVSLLMYMDVHSHMLFFFLNHLKVSCSTMVLQPQYYSIIIKKQGRISVQPWNHQVPRNLTLCNIILPFNTQSLFGFPKWFR